MSSTWISGDYLVIAGAPLEVEAEVLTHQFAERNGNPWSPPPNDPHGDETVEMMVGVTSGAVSATAPADGVRERIDPA